MTGLLETFLRQRRPGSSLHRHEHLWDRKMPCSILQLQHTPVLVARHHVCYLFLEHPELLGFHSLFLSPARLEAVVDS